MKILGAAPSSPYDAIRKTDLDTRVPQKVTSGSTAPTSPSVGDIWIDTSQSAGGGSSYTRATATVTTSSLANNANSQTTVALAQGYRLMKIQTSAAARVRIYAGSTYQAADVNRNVNKLPSGDHGLVFEYSTTTSVLSAVLSPFVDGATFDATNNVPITVTNLSGSSAAITVTLTWIRTE